MYGRSMDSTPVVITTNTSSTTSSKSPEPEITLTPTTRIQAQPSKPTHLPFTNGLHKRHYHGHQSPPSVTYKECLKNHAAALGSHALDGCGEFMPSPNSTSTDPTSLKCAACGCHRNFHRREPDHQESISTTHLIEYHPHHRHHPPPPNRNPNSSSPPPISSSYYPSAPHMLLALSGGLSVAVPESTVPGQLTNGTVSRVGQNGRKRYRTKFSREQKEKMYKFAERVGWKMQKRDENLIKGFCNEIGIEKGVLKVWLHNNKNTVGKKEFNGTGITFVEYEKNNNNDAKDDDDNGNHVENNRNEYEEDEGRGHNGATNGSS